MPSKINLFFFNHLLFGNFFIVNIVMQYNMTFKPNNTMKTNFKGTKGRLYVDGSHICLGDENKKSLDHETVFVYIPDTKYPTVYKRSSAEANANAKLVIDAFNVRQQINVDLPELLKQRDELLEVVKEAKRVICSMKLSMWVHPDCSQDSEFYDMATTGEETEDKLEDLITKIEQK